MELIDVLQVVAILILAAVAHYFSGYKAHKAELAEVSLPHGLHYEDFGDRAKLWGVVEGHPIEIETWLSMKYTKHQHIEVKATFKLSDAPEGFCLYPEGVASGMERLGNKSEIEFDDPDFDDAFWVLADNPGALYEYLTPSRRQALLHWLVRMGDGSIENGVLTRKGVQGTMDSAFGLAGYVGGDSVGKFLSQFIGLAKAFAGDDQYHQSTAELAQGWVAARKVRNIAWWSGILGLACWILPLEIHMPHLVEEFDHLLMVVSLATTAAAVFGQRGLVLALTTLLGSLIGLGFVAAAGALFLMGQKLAALIPLLFMVAWVIVWAGALIHLKSLKGAS